LDKPPKSNLFINEWGFVDDELPIRNTLYAIRYFLHSPRCTLHAKRYFLHSPRCTLHAPQGQARTKKPFYAKQTQFPPILRQKRGFCPKTNPIQTQFKPNSNPIKPNFILFFAPGSLRAFSTSPDAASCVWPLPRPA